MLLYHGTTKKIADKAIKTGLKPRGKLKSNWAQASDPNSIYLTNAYAPYFSVSACGAKSENFGAVIAVDTNELNPALFFADEDACEQATRKQFEIYRTMEYRTSFWRDNPYLAAENGMSWKWSLDILGTCRYSGPIPPNAIKKIAFWNERDRTMLTVFDPTITLMNYHIMGSRYRYLMQKMMKEPITEILDGIGQFVNGQENAIDTIFSNITLKEMN